MPDNDANKVAGKDAIDITKYVPKEDFEKLGKTSKEQISALQNELDQAKLSLLDPEYISFLESKKGKDLKKEADKITDRLKDGTLSADERAHIEGRIDKLSAAVEDILALQELAAVEKKYSDFDTYRDKTRQILETSPTPLTIEQAYLLACGQTKTEKTAAEKEAAAKTGTEKPGAGTTGTSTEPVSFKDKKSAADAAWDTVVGAGKDNL